MAHPQLSGNLLALVAVLGEHGTVPAAVLSEVGTAVYAVFVPVATDQYGVLFAEGQVVLPGGLIAIGVEHETLSAELVAFVVSVLAMGQFKA
ncbi:hypothetical protein D9M73_188260 [compost metagenome]